MIARLIFFLALVSTLALAQDTFPEEDAGEVYTEAEIDAGHELVAPESLAITRAYRERELSVKEFDEELWRAVIGDKDYNEEPIIKSDFEGPNISWAGPVVKVVAYIAVLALVVFIIYQIVKNIDFDLKVKREDLEGEDFERPLEDIESLDVDGLLEQARREGNFRVAVRLYYLGLLKKLNALGRISWKKDKTNRDYMSELFAGNFYYQEIHRLTLAYESAWYGGHVLKDDAFESLRRSFEDIYQKIQNANML